MSIRFDSNGRFVGADPLPRKFVRTVKIAVKRHAGKMWNCDSCGVKYKPLLPFGTDLLCPECYVERNTKRVEDGDVAIQPGLF